MQTHAQLSTQETEWMKTHAQLSKHANKCSALEPHADKRSALGTSQRMQVYTDLSIRANKCRYLIISWYEQTHAEICKAWDTCIHMQSFNTCMYMHSSNTCRCIQSHTLDEYRIIHVKHERANMDGEWEGKPEWKTVISYAAHDHEPNAKIFRPSKHVPSL